LHRESKLMATMTSTAKSQTTARMTTLGDLPDQALTIVIGYVDAASRPAARRVSRRWCTLADAQLAHRRCMQGSFKHICVAPDRCANRYVRRLIACRRLSLLRWAHATGGFALPDDACNKASAANDLPMLQWLRSVGCPWGPDACINATIHGNLDMLRWIRANDGPWASALCSLAAKYGHMHILEWAALQDCCTWDTSTCAYAAWRGDLIMLEWLRQRGCPWNADTCALAAERGHLAVLQWAYNNGCPIDQRVNVLADRAHSLPFLS